MIIPELSRIEARPIPPSTRLRNEAFVHRDGSRNGSERNAVEDGIANDCDNNYAGPTAHPESQDEKRTQPECQMFNNSVHLPRKRSDKRQSDQNNCDASSDRCSHNCAKSYTSDHGCIPDP